MSKGILYSLTSMVGTEFANTLVIGTKECPLSDVLTETVKLTWAIPTRTWMLTR